MSEVSQEESRKITTAYHELISSQQTLILATVSADSLPQISYAPYVRDQEGTFYIYVSELAHHTANLLKNQQASVLFIRAESESGNLFARERIVFNCRVEEIKRDDENYESQLQAMQEKFGEVVAILRTLADFHLFALRPESGQYVVGFGRAFTINSTDETLNHIGMD